MRCGRAKGRKLVAATEVRAGWLFLSRCPEEWAEGQAASDSGRRPLERGKVPRWVWEDVAAERVG